MFRSLLLSAALVPLALACAPIGASASPPLSAEQRALTADQRDLVAQTCDRVMGLREGGLYRSECMDSLARSLADKVETARLADSYSACRGQGLHEGTAAFSTCVLDYRGAARAAQPVAYDGTRPENAKSYFGVDNREHWRREQYSCAQIGLTPGTAAFSQCMVNLNGALLPNPF